MNQTNFVRCVCLIGILMALSSRAFSLPSETIQGESANQFHSSLTLPRALHKVLRNDYPLQRAMLDARAFAAEAESKDVLPDPVVFAALQNIPTDSFDLDQESMTQFRVGVKQMFPKGDSRTLNRNIVLHAQAEQYLQQKQRILTLRQQTEATWLEAWYWQTSKTLIEKDRIFLTQMLDFMHSVYQLGGNNQSDLLGAELELIRLDDKLLEADRQYKTFRYALNTLANEVLNETRLDESLVNLPFKAPPPEDELYALLNRHPEFLMLDETIAQQGKKIALSEQDFAPQWGVELSYALRQDAPNGMKRADLISAGVSVQLPLFSKPQKSKAVSALKYKQAALENKRLELFKKVRFELENLVQQYRTTVDQRQLYETRILPTLSKQKDSALQSYQSDRGDFRVVTDLFIKEQSTRMTHQRLRVSEQALISKLNYWLSTSPDISNLSLDQEKQK